MVSIEVSATTVVNQSDNLFQTASRRAVVTSGFPLLLITLNFLPVRAAWPQRGAYHETLVCTFFSVYSNIEVHSSMYQVQSDMYWYVLVHTGTYKLLCTN